MPRTYNANSYRYPNEQGILGVTVDPCPHCYHYDRNCHGLPELRLCPGHSCLWLLCQPVATPGPAG